MNKRRFTQLLILSVIVMAGWSVAANTTTDSWSGPSASGTRTSTRLTLSKPLVTGAWTNSGTGTHSGANTFSGTTTFSGSTSLTGGGTNSGNNTFSGTNTFSGPATFTSAQTTVSNITAAIVTAVTAVVSGEVTIDSKYAVVGPNGTTPWMIQTNGITLGSGTLGLVTGTWDVAFGGIAIPNGNYASGGATTNAVYFTSWTASNFVAGGHSSKAVLVHGMGPRP